MKMTLAELKHLTQSQIKAYVLSKKPNAKAPKKWENKTKCLAWAEKTLGEKSTEPVQKPKATKAKKKSPSNPLTASYSGNERRADIAKLLKKEPCTALELAYKFDVKYKSILDDIHAIRHGRGSSVVVQFLDHDEILTDIRIEKTKIYGICKKNDEENFKKKLAKSLTL